MSMFFLKLISLLLTILTAFSCSFGALLMLIYYEEKDIKRSFGILVLVSAFLAAIQSYSIIDDLELTGFEKIIVCICTVISFCFFVWLFSSEENKRKKKKELDQKILEYTKHFGDCKLTLFRFTDKQYVKDNCVWALVAFDAEKDSVFSIKEHDRYKYIDSWEESQTAKKEEVEAEIIQFIRHLPYSIPVKDARISFEEYRQAADDKKIRDLYKNYEKT